MESCLADEYGSRITALGKAAVTAGPFLLSRVDLFQAVPAELIEELPFQPDYAIRKATAGSEEGNSGGLVVDGEVRFAATDKMEDAAFTAEQTRDSVDKPENWGITAKGLSLLFNEYSVASFAFGTQEVPIPWRDLKPYLVQPPPFPIQFD